MLFAELFELVTHTLFIVGLLATIAGFLLSFIPGLSLYKLPLQILGIVVLVSGTYFEGMLAKDKKHKQEIADLELKLKDAEIKAAAVNTKVIKEVLTRREVIKEKGEDIIKYIDREVVKFDNTCPIPESVIKAHNAGALNRKIEESVIATPTSPVETKQHNDAAKPKILLPKK